MNKRIVAGMALTLAVLGGVWSATAASVSGETAKLAVKNWLERQPQLGCRLGEAPSAVRTCSTNGASFHVVSLEGGGFVVTSTDTGVEPIIAFSESDRLVESDENPLWVMLIKDLSKRSRRAPVMAAGAAGGNATASAGASSAPAQKWASLMHGQQTGTSASVNVGGGQLRSVQYATGKTSVSDLRVSPLVATRWDQKQDSLYSNRGNPCYNYYTPNNYPCGCVATAGAQVMKYHCFPTKAVAAKQYGEAGLKMQGGNYTWDKMPEVPANGTTLEQRQAIGKLTSDLGIACLMEYGENGSAAGVYMLKRALTGDFGYANAVAAQYSGNCPGATLMAAIIPNLDAGLPVVVSVENSSYGHAVVADGYGYSMETLYVHFNLGWSGRGDAWYAPPDIEDYSMVNGVVCNIYPEGVAGGVICSGRVLDKSGKPVSGAEVRANGSKGALTSCTTDANGIYALILSPGTHNLVAAKAGESASLKVTLKANVSVEISDRGTYYSSPVPQVNNCYGQDFTLAAGGGGEDPEEPEDPEETGLKIDVSAITAGSFAVGVVGDGSGVPIKIEPLSSVKSVKATKLPSGMKLVKDKQTGEWMLTGTPKKAGSYKVTITVVTTDKVKHVVEVPMEVEALAPWATGTFGGMIGHYVGDRADNCWLGYGMIDMKIATTGKITAKITTAGKTYSFSATGFTAVEEEDGYRSYRFSMSTKKGEVYEGEITEAYHDVATLTSDGYQGDPEGTFAPKDAEPYLALVWRNEHGKDGRLKTDKSGKAKKVMDSIKALAKVNLAAYDPAYGSAALAIGKDGSVKLSGTTTDGVKLSGKSFLMLHNDNYHIIADIVVYDKKSKEIYYVVACWQPIFDSAGNIAGWNYECCDHSMRRVGD